MRMCSALISHLYDLSKVPISTSKLISSWPWLWRLDLTPCDIPTWSLFHDASQYPVDLLFCFPSTYWALPIGGAGLKGDLALSNGPMRAAKPGSPGSNNPLILQSVCSATTRPPLWQSGRTRSMPDLCGCPPARHNNTPLVPASRTGSLPAKSHFLKLMYSLSTMCAGKGFPRGSFLEELNFPSSLFVNNSASRG